MDTPTHLADTNWDYLLSLLPQDWRDSARKSGAVVRLRGTTSVENLLRVLLLHIAHGCSLRTTVVMARQAGWADMSDVALLKRLRCSENWLRQMCVGLLEQSGLSMPQQIHGMSMRLVDSTIIREPGDTGSQWRVLYSLRVPDWQCDSFRLTSTKGAGNGESMKYYSIRPGDCLLADRGFSHLAGIESVRRRGGHVIVRLNEQNVPLQREDGSPLVLADWLDSGAPPGEVRSTAARIDVASGSGRGLAVRLCAVRKSFDGQALAERKLRRKAVRRQNQLREETISNNAWIVVLTTVEDDVLDDVEVLEWYRIRWQIELAFKRLKSLGDAGHLPKRDPRSSRAWVYGKLLVALLTEKMQRHAAAFSPWGGQWMEQDPPPEPLA